MSARTTPICGVGLENHNMRNVAVMSNWNRSYGYDEDSGNRVVVVEEIAEGKPYMSLVNRFSIASMKLVFALGIFLLVPLGLIFRVLS